MVMSTKKKTNHCEIPYNRPGFIYISTYESSLRSYIYENSKLQPIACSGVALPRHFSALIMPCS